MSRLFKEPKLIIAADNLSSKEFYQLLFAMEEFKKEKSSFLWGVKLTDVLVRLGTPAIKLVVEEFGLKVMADLKCSDINTTNSTLIEVMLKAGASIVTIQTTAGYKADPLGQGKYLAGVTVLTTIEDKHRRDKVLRLTAAAKALGYRYVVCGAPDLADMRLLIEKEPQIIPICPGIRPKWYPLKEDNQKSKATPSDAVMLGARGLVVGRPIIQNKEICDLKSAISRTLEEIEKAWHLL